MRAAITGASGFLGGHLTRSLRGDGHEVIRLVRRVPRARDEVRWDPDSGHVDLAGLQGVDALIHLAGAGLGERPWTPAYRRLVYDSRVTGTRTIATASASLEPKPRVLLSMSGVGYYGNPGDQIVDEQSPTGDSYIAQIVRGWERATTPAAAAGVRVVTPRTGIVMASDGGALGRILLPFRLGVGGRIGSGDQFWSWVALVDYVRAIRHLLDRADIEGPINVCTPNPVTNRQLTDALARLLSRPAALPVPGAALRLVFRDFADDLLAGQRVVPTKLLASGFTFEKPDVEPVLREVLTGARTTS